MKRVLAFVLALWLIVPGLGPAMAEVEEWVLDDEVARARHYGLVPDSMPEDLDAAVTMRQYCAMLDAVVERVDAPKMNAWKLISALARRDASKISREQAMLALFYAAIAIDHFQPEEGDAKWYETNEAIGEPWDQFSWRHDWFPEHLEPVPAGWAGQDFTYSTSAYFFAMCKTSRITHATVFDYDAADNSMHVDRPLTVRDAILSAIRLYESTEPGTRAWWRVAMEVYGDEEPAEAPVDEGIEPADPAQVSGPMSPEIEEAVSLGLGESGGDQRLRFRDFVEILDRAVALADPDKLGDWQARYPWIRQKDDPINRGQAIFLIYCAAEVLGPDYCQFADGNWPIANDRMPDPWTDYKVTEDLFPDAFKVPLYAGSEFEFNRFVSAYFFSFAQYSKKTNQPLFDSNAEGTSMRAADPLTMNEALLAAVRLVNAKAVGQDTGP